MYTAYLKHGNITLSQGLKDILNNPKMYIWHSVKALPENYSYGLSFGVLLSM